MPRTPRPWTTRLAMLGGLLLGLLMLWSLRIQPPDPQSRVRPVAAPPAPVLQAAPPRSQRPGPRAPVLEPADEPEPEPEDEALVEPIDSGLPDTVQVALWIEDSAGNLLDPTVDNVFPRVQDCDVLGYDRVEDGSITLTLTPGDVCSAWAMRLDGLLRTRSDTLEFEAEEGTEIVLVLPSERRGGIGVQFQPDGDAMLVVMVMPGSPAWEAGLMAGDRIVGVAGLSVDELDSEAFVDEMTGPEGTEIDFELETESDTGIGLSTVTLTRAFLSG